jgi:hypothetical protein
VDEVMKKIQLFSFLFFTILAATSCKKDYNAQVCEELLFKKFKGFPNAANEFSKNCQDVPIKFNQKICQKALKGLVLDGNINRLKRIHGEKVENCFTQNDLLNFKK